MKVQIKYPKAKCKWCGNTYEKKHNRQMYCSDKCRTEALREQNRNNRNKWYHKNKHRICEDKKYGLGSGYLSQHKNPDHKKEQEIIQREKQRLGI